MAFDLDVTLLPRQQMPVPMLHLYLTQDSQKFQYPEPICNYCTTIRALARILKLPVIFERAPFIHKMLLKRLKLSLHTSHHR